MSLRATTRLPVMLPESMAALELQFFREAFSPAPPPMPLPLLQIPLQPQDNPVWCYAACTSMAISFVKQIDPPVPQCTIVGFVKFPLDTNGVESAECCNGFGPNFECVSTGCEIDDIGRIFARWQVNFVPTGPVTFTDLDAEFQASRPALVVIEWPNTDGKHALVFVGTSGDFLFLLDPLETYGGWRTITSLENFEGGSWLNTWTGLT